MLALAYALLASLAGDPAYEEGLRLYKGLEYEQAILRLEEVAVRPGLTPADKANVLAWLGLSYAGTGDLDSAKRNLRQALIADDDVALPTSTSPRIVTMFEELRTQVKQEKATAAANDTHVEEHHDIVPPPPPPPPPDNRGTFVIVGGATAGVGALALIGAGVLGFVASDQLAKANDTSGFQDDGKKALDAANGSATGALVLLPVGVVLAGAGGALLALNMGD